MDHTPLILCRNRVVDGDVYWLDPKVREQLDGTHGAQDRPGKVVLGGQPPLDLNDLQRVALVEILTGLRGEELQGYSVEITDWTFNPLEVWGILHTSGPTEASTPGGGTIPG